MRTEQPDGSLASTYTVQVRVLSRYCTRHPPQSSPPLRLALITSPARLRHRLFPSSCASSPWPSSWPVYHLQYCCTAVAQINRLLLLLLCCRSSKVRPSYPVPTLSQTFLSWPPVAASDTDLSQALNLLRLQLSCPEPVPLQATIIALPLTWLACHGIGTIVHPPDSPFIIIHPPGLQVSQFWYQPNLVSVLVPTTLTYRCYRLAIRRRQKYSVSMPTCWSSSLHLSPAASRLPRLAYPGAPTSSHNFASPCEYSVHLLSSQRQASDIGRSVALHVTWSRLHPQSRYRYLQHSEGEDRRCSARYSTP